MNNKRVPPSVAQFAVSERAELLARIAELGVTIARLESQLSRAIQANYDLRTKLVVPSPDVLGRAFITCESSDAGYRVVIKSERMQEAQQLHNWLARLNAAPAAPAADAGLVEALDYQVLFDAIAAATSVYANGAINISVQAFRDALAAPAAPAADAPPENCRQRLAAEGKPYPKSSCAACGQFSPKWRECDAAIAAHRAKGVV